MRLRGSATVLESYEQRELRSVARDFFAGCSPVAALTHVPAQTVPWTTQWQQATQEMGLSGIAVPDALGGAGATFVEAAIVLEEAGGALTSMPIGSTLAVIQALSMCGDSGALSLVERMVAEGLSAALAVGDCEASADGSRWRIRGGAPVVLDADSADLIILIADVGGIPTLFVVETPDDLSRIRIETLDQSRGFAGITTDGLMAHRICVHEDHACAQRAIDIMRLSLALDSVGAAYRALEVTKEYLALRQQFGVPIGSFQALQHRAADLLIAVDAAGVFTRSCAAALAAGDTAFEVMAPMAKAVATDAFELMAEEMIQLHGGIGFTWEHQAHLFLKRAAVNAQLLGSSDELRLLAAERARV